MSRFEPTIAPQVARTAIVLQEQGEGHDAQEVTVALSDGTPVKTLHGLPAPAEQALAGSPAGGAVAHAFTNGTIIQVLVLTGAISWDTGMEGRSADSQISPGLDS